MSTKAAPLGLRLFLEGIEVPIISAQVNIMPDRPATAAVQVIPTDMAMNLLPRTLVHVFFLDPDEVLNPYAKPRVSDIGQENNQNRFEASDNQYKLLFCGEVIGFNYGKSSDARQLVLQCMDLSSYWDTCYQWFADYSVGGGGLTDRSHQFVGAGASMFNSVAGGHQWVIGRIINSKPKSKSYQNTSGLLAGLIRLMEAIGGVRYMKGDPGFNGVNDFFTIAELRYNLLGMIGAVEKDDTSAKMFANKAFRAWLKNGMTSLGSLLSFRDIINHVNKHIYHNIYPNPAPYYVEYNADATTKTRTVYSTIYQDDRSNGPPLASALREIRKKMDAVKDMFYHVLVVETGESAEENVPLSFEIGVERVGAIDKEVDAAIRNYADNLKTDDKSSVKSDMEDVRSKLGTIQSGGVRSGSLVDLARDNVDILEEAVAIVDGLLGPKKRSKKGRKEIKIPDGAHLYNQLVLPELFFAPPPRCNVIFPDQYFQFSFSRNFMREVTRLSCRGGLGMIAGGRRGAKLLGSHYFAPNVKDSRGKSLYSTWDKGARILMPHEVHSGIIPKFEWVTDGHRWGVKAAKSTGSSDAFFESGKVGYVQRLANYQLYLHRWSARSISLTGVFNPNLVLGLPAMVMDRSMPAPVVVKMFENMLGRKWMPNQYLGKIESIMHQVNQGGGQTAVQLSKCRTHRALDDEFLGVLMREVEETKEVTRTLKLNTKNLLQTEALSKAPAGGTANVGSSAGPKYYLPDATFEEIKRIIRKYVNTPNGEIKGMRVFKNREVVKKVESKGDRVILSSAEASKLGIIGSPADKWNRTVVTEEAVYDPLSADETNFRFITEPEPGEVSVVQVEVDAVWLPETIILTLGKVVATGETDVVKRTVEQAIKPGWYSDVWSNERIGSEAYMQLIGVDAITDNVSVSADKVDELIDRAFKEESTKLASKIDENSNKEVYSYEETDSMDESGTIQTLNVLPGSIEEAVDSIAILYGLIKSRDGDIQGFISNYTKRPIANMTDILGTPNLILKDDGEYDTESEGTEDTLEGFHSRAFGDYNTNVRFPSGEETEVKPGDRALHGLFEGIASGSSVERESILDRGEGKFAVNPAMDPRGRAYARVTAYVQELRVSRGLLG